MKGTVDIKIPYLTSLSFLQNQQQVIDNMRSEGSLTKSITHISSGLRVINAKEDLVNFEFEDRFDDIKKQGLNKTIPNTSKAIQNTNDALSAVQVAKTSLNEYMDVLGYMKELAEKSSDSNTDNSDRKTFQEEMIVLQERLRNISDETTFKGRQLINGNYKFQEIQIGEAVGQTMSISMKSTRTDQIGLHQLTSEGGINDAGNFRSALYASIDNGISELDNFTIQGFMGAELIDIPDYSDAKQIAELINEKTELTGVEATAKTYAKIYNLSKTGDVSFILHGASEVEISATIESIDDLTPLYEDFELKSPLSQITPKLSTDKDAIYLYAENGENIGIEDFDNTLFPTLIKFAGLQPDGETIAGTENTLISDIQGSILVGGYVDFNSDEPFLLFTGSGTALFYENNTTQFPGLNALDYIDISSMENASDALEIINNSNTYIERIQSELQAYESGFQSIINRLEAASDQEVNSRHSIVDLDMAEETLKLSRATIHVQSQNALITQANRLIPEYSLFLVRQ